MSVIPKEAKPDFDPTLERMNEEIARIGNSQDSRTYLGAYQIGGECSRALWYSFRWCAKKQFDGPTHRRFEDGHRGEDLMASRLRLVPGIELHTLDPRTGHQFEMVAHGGHFKAHMDGAIYGILQAPKSWSVWEHKCTNEKKQEKLAKLKAELGEKQALASWDAVYYAQAQVYMKYTGMKRHYLTCSSPGERDTVSVRTNYCAKDADATMDKALKIIQSPEPLQRVSEKPEYYLCGPKWCDYRDICHKQAIPDVNCRTCAHSTPEMDGDGRWSCARHKADIPVEWQRKGCDQHVFIPALLPFKAIDASEHEGWIEYEVVERRFKNGPGHYSSNEIKVTDQSLLGDQVVEALKKPSGEDWLKAPTQSSQSQNPSWSSAETAQTSKETPSVTVPAWATAPLTAKVQDTNAQEQQEWRR